MQKEQTAGVVGSLLFHTCIGVVLFFWVIPEPREIPEFVELSWGSSASFLSPASGSQGSSQPSPAVTPQRSSESSLPVVLPERRAPKDNDLLTVPQREKLDVNDVPGGTKLSVKGAPTLRRDQPRSGAGRGQAAGSGEGTAVGGKPGQGLGEGPGTSAGSGVSMAMEWTGGGTRRKLSGALPAYPAGEANEAQIRLEAVVTPEGRVRSVRPIQKANARMEDAALREVRLWTFEPLPPGVAQKDQTCLITFNFRLR
jgi:TonB family protein